MATRTDISGELAPSFETPEGFLKIESRSTRTGVFSYRRPDGSLARELRPPEEVNDLDSLASLGGKPITLDHPPCKLTPDNVGEYSVGTTGNDILACGGFVRVRGDVHRRDAIEALRSTHGEISNGYNCDLDPVGGLWCPSDQTYVIDSEGPNGPVPEGEERFDMIQRRIRYNHMAIVPVGTGRAGRECVSRVDSDHAEEIPVPTNGTPSEGATQMASIEIDGISYEVEDEKLVEAINAKLAQLDAAAELMQKALDAVSAERDAAKEQVEGEPERIDSLISERIASRLALERQAGPHMGDLKCDGLSDREIRLQAVKQLTGKDLSSKDDGYLTVYSEITLENAVTRTDALDADLDSLQAVGQIPKAEVSEAAKRADATAKILENSKNRYSQEAV